MFCFQCEQTAGCTGCTGKAGVCCKDANAAGFDWDAGISYITAYLHTLACK